MLIVLILCLILIGGAELFKISRQEHRKAGAANLPASSFLSTAHRISQQANFCPLFVFVVSFFFFFVASTARLHIYPITLNLSVITSTPLYFFALELTTLQQIYHNAFHTRRPVRARGACWRHHGPSHPGFSRHRKYRRTLNALSHPTFGKI